MEATPATDQLRRKRKRIARPLYFYSFSVRSLLLCFAFLSFLYLLSRHIPITPSSFRPVLKVSSFPLLSSTTVTSSSSNLSIRLYPRNRLASPVKIEDRILFPDHVLLLVANLRDLRMKKGDCFDCVYFTSSVNDDITRRSSFKRKALSIDEWNELQSIVRCPLPPPAGAGNYSADGVSLEIRGRKSVDGTTNRTTHSWETVAYAAALDGNTAVVFAKGLNLRPDRESDPRQFSCHFRWEKDVITTKAITAAQEVVRCSLPRTLRLSPSNAQGVRVTVGVTPPRTRDRVLVPSVAKISNPRPVPPVGEKKKYELCACTMVWNQAAALREWIQYHTWLGVEKWFIYDNNSDDGIKEVVLELQQEDYNVSRHVWPWIKTQEAGFSHCAIRARDECNWVGFMDVDEFFYFPFPTHRNQNQNQRLGFPSQNSLRTLVSNFSTTTVAEIRTSCHSFGPSGLSSPPPQGVTVGYTCRLQSPERHKSIIRPDALDTTLLNVVHHFHLRKGFTYLNLPQSTAVINHYKYQVWESFRAKFFRRVATYVVDWQENQNEGSRDRAPGLGTEAIEPPDWRLRFCEVWDTGLRDYVLANLADSATGLLPWERSSL